MTLILLALTAMEIKTIINGKKETVTVREFNDMYQILTGPYTMGLIRKDEVINDLKPTDYHNWSSFTDNNGWKYTKD